MLVCDVYIFNVCCVFLFASETKKKVLNIIRIMANGSIFYNNHHNCTYIETTWPINVFSYIRVEPTADPAHTVLVDLFFSLFSSTPYSFSLAAHCGKLILLSKVFIAFCTRFSTGIDRKIVAASMMWKRERDRAHLMTLTRYQIELQKVFFTLSFSLPEQFSTFIVLCWRHVHFKFVQHFHYCQNPFIARNDLSYSHHCDCYCCSFYWCGCRWYRKASIDFDV